MQTLYVVWQGIRKKAQKIQKYSDCPHILSHGGYDLLENKLLDEKRKTRQEEAMLTKNTPLIEDPPSPIERHVKWKMAHSKRYGQMTSQAAQEISNRIMSLCLTYNLNLIFFCIIIATSFDVFQCRVCYRTHYKNRRQRVALFPKVVKTYSILSLGDRSMQVMFVHWDLVWKSITTLEGHHMPPTIPPYPSPNNSWLR